MQKIKLFDVSTDDSEKSALNSVFDSHFWASGSGTGKVKKFEENFCSPLFNHKTKTEISDPLNSLASNQNLLLKNFCTLRFQIF